ncbi:MAG TPA: nuclear transport factor 2 family protein [Mycobacteriales bacterium]|nr:nuclear transport factor 2 family protein [Mycobacteriales bacterium]HWA68018.1 nuclear transport factor 2 family protein [Mycobacteriales bacterium]
MIADLVGRWHRFVEAGDPALLDALLADDVVFYSPVVYTPQRGKAVTTMYLKGATQVLAGDGGDGAFRYVKEVLAGDSAVLEFETSLDGKYVNGVDIIRCDETGKIVEFRVMLRPLQAINAVHAAMGAMLEALEG